MFIILLLPIYWQYLPNYLAMALDCEYEASYPLLKQQNDSYFKFIREKNTTKR